MENFNNKLPNKLATKEHYLPPTPSQEGCFSSHKIWRDLDQASKEDSSPTEDWDGGSVGPNEGTQLTTAPSQTNL